MHSVYHKPHPVLISPSPPELFLTYLFTRGLIYSLGCFISLWDLYSCGFLSPCGDLFPGEKQSRREIHFRGEIRLGMSERQLVIYVFIVSWEGLMMVKTYQQYLAEARAELGLESVPSSITKAHQPSEIEMVVGYLDMAMGLKQDRRALTRYGLDQLYLVRRASTQEYSAWEKSAQSWSLTALCNVQKNDALSQTATRLGFNLPTRNTLHFGLNCLVDDHIYGKFGADCILIFALKDVLERQTPSSITQVDVALPYKRGCISLPQPAATFSYESGNDMHLSIKNWLEERGSFFKRSSQHCWSGSSFEDDQYINDLAQSIGQGMTQPCSHAQSVEGGAELQIGKFLSAAHAIECGELNDESGRYTVPNLNLMTNAAAKVADLRAAATHPDTRDQLSLMVKQMGSATVQAHTHVQSIKNSHQEDAEASPESPSM